MASYCLTDSVDRSGFVGVDITRATPRQPQSRNPYQPVGDFLSNISKFQVIESTLREGEQYVYTMKS